VSAGVRSGRVTEFDEHVGLGVVTADDGEGFPFHCTQIADGSRSIDVGAAVTFTVRVDRPKGPEAYEITHV
jgi:CspA family cold shock protein